MKGSLFDDDSYDYDYWLFTRIEIGACWMLNSLITWFRLASLPIYCKSISPLRDSEFLWTETPLKLSSRELRCMAGMAELLGDYFNFDLAADSISFIFSLYAMYSGLSG